MSLINQRFEISAIGNPEALSIPTHYLYQYSATNPNFETSGFWDTSAIEQGYYVGGVKDLQTTDNELSPYVYELGVTPVVVNNGIIEEMGNTFTHDVYAVYLEEKITPHITYLDIDDEISIELPVISDPPFDHVKYKIDDGTEQIDSINPAVTSYSIDVSQLAPTTHTIVASIGYTKEIQGTTQVVYSQEEEYRW